MMKPINCLWFAFVNRIFCPSGLYTFQSWRPRRTIHLPRNVFFRRCQWLSHNEEVLRPAWILNHILFILFICWMTKSSKFFITFHHPWGKGLITRSAAIPHQTVTFGFEYDFLINLFGIFFCQIVTVMSADESFILEHCLLSQIGFFKLEV